MTVPPALLAERLTLRLKSHRLLQLFSFSWFLSCFCEVKTVAFFGIVRIGTGPTIYIFLDYYMVYSFGIKTQLSWSKWREG